MNFHAKQRSVIEFLEIKMFSANKKAEDIGGN